VLFQAGPPTAATPSKSACVPGKNNDNQVMPVARGIKFYLSDSLKARRAQFMFTFTSVLEKLQMRGFMQHKKPMKG
jgi:hypothetical protein